MSGPSWDYIAKCCVIGDSGCGKSSLTVRLCEGRFTSSHDVTIGVEFGSRIVPVGPPASLALGINNPDGSSTIQTTTPSAQTQDSESQQQSSKTIKPPLKSSKSSKSKSASLPDPPRTKSSQKHMKLSLWDTAGQETYKSITRSYFRGASGALLVFDITRRNTFESVTQWLHDLIAIAEEGIVVILVGNKSDLAGASLVEGETSPESTEPQSNKRAVTQSEAKEWCRRNGVFQYVETSAKSGEGVERAFLEVAERIFQNIEAGKYDLNDRRSGVKGPGAGAGARGGGSGGGGNRAGGEVVLGVNEVGGMNRDGKRGWGGGCC